MLFSSVTVFPVAAFCVTMFFLRKKLILVGNQAFCSVLVACVAGVIAFAVNLTVLVITPHTSLVEEYDKVKIVALSTSSLVYGSFFLGSGQIDEQLYYSFYLETPDGGKKLTRISAYNVTLYEEDRSDAFYVKLSQKNKWSGHGWVFNFFTPLSFHDADFQHAIHIPKGSIKEEIRLDLPK